jgi:REP element-mobilizing transposase RayT
MANTFTNIQFHLVFSTKNREPAITRELQPRLYDYIGGIVRAEKGSLYEIGGTRDHVHMLLRWRTDEALATLMRKVKGNSSRWVHQEFPTLRGFRWQTGYGAFSVSQSQSGKVKDYISRQPEHHRKKGFKEEFVELLRAHGIDYDERYLWD